jgi:long-chain acyl-CoA synthetase
MVLVSGYNVYPNEVEAVAAGCAGVVVCACVGVPDVKTGVAVRLFVVRDGDDTVTEAQLRAHCCKELASYKVPRSISFVDAHPKSTVGMILRRALRETD